MKKVIIKFAVLSVIFVIAVVVIGRIMNKGHDNLTVEMAKASFPLITMSMNGTEYNQLHGYAMPMEVAYQRDTITVLGENRNIDFVVDTFDNEVEGVSIEVRNLTGTRLIEDTPVTSYQKKGKQITGTIALKDLIEADTEYSLTVVLDTRDSGKVYYYTKVIWSDQLHVEEKMEFVIDFHERLYDREMARDLTKYLETNSKLEDNTSFHKVNIHSSFRQITWGDLNVDEVEAPLIRLTEIAGQTASFIMDYRVTTGSGKEKVRYIVQEYYRVRYSTSRMYLLDYERTMTEMPNEENMYANDKILLGITDTDVPFVESDDGNIVVFEAADRLFAYDITTNKLTVVFAFYDKQNTDRRTLYNQNSIKILDVDEGGNIKFAVYGYMNRGRHEGEVGIQLYAYNSGMNTSEELVYIPTKRTYSALAADLEQLMYLNRDGILFLQMDGCVYEINLEEKSYTAMVDILHDESLYVSDNHRIIVWPQGEDVYGCNQLNIMNLNEQKVVAVKVTQNQAIMPLGFMDEDIIYGVAFVEDIVKENSGKVFFPMYKLCICDDAGNTLKEYRQPDIYITNCSVDESQITLDRLQRTEDGKYKETYQDQIMNNSETIQGKNRPMYADIDVYERYVQIQLRSNIDVKSMQILNPKEVVFEGGRVLELPDINTERERYFVYGSGGVQGIYNAPSKAIKLAYNISGVVVNQKGELIWLKGNRVSRNQIMAIKEASSDENISSLAVCLDTIFKFEGLVRNSQYLLNQGKNTLQILEENLEDTDILDLTGCNLDAILYYVNQDIPVLALLQDGEAVLVTGFNEYNVVIMEPSTGKLYKKGMNDSKEWFEANGNHFITYSRNTD